MSDKDRLRRRANKMKLVLFWECIIIIGLASVVGLGEANTPLFGYRGGARSVDGLKPKHQLAHSAVAILTAGQQQHGLPGDLPWHVADKNDHGDDGSDVSCILFDDNHVAMSQISRLPWDLDMTRSLTFLCDAIILVMQPDQKEDIDRQLVTSLVEGAKKRKEAGLGKSRLIVVTPYANDETTNSARLDDMIQRQLSDILPSEWDCFDIVESTLELKTYLKEIFSPHYTGTLCEIFPNEDGDDDDNTLLFSKLLHQIYQVESGKNIAPFLVKAVSGPSSSKTATSNTVSKDKVTVTETDRKDQTDRIQQTLIECQAGLAELESKLQDVLLSEDGQQMPLVDFGKQADRLLNQAYGDLTDIVPAMRMGILKPVVIELCRLYRDQLQALRDYYGKRYERTLEESNDEGDWTAAAEHIMQGFQAAAINAVPALCKQGEPLAEIANFDSTNCLQGLVTDMLEATQIRKNEQSLAMEGEDDNDDESPGRFHRVPPWLKKFAGRVLVFGVNYIQGWLAWQGVKRAAMERDRAMPKFPLF